MTEELLDMTSKNTPKNVYIKKGYDQFKDSVCSFESKSAKLDETIM